MASKRSTKADEAATEEFEKGLEAMRVRAYDEYFQLCSDMYFGNLGGSIEQVRAGLDAIEKEPNELKGPVGGILTSPYRTVEILDDWTPIDVALFIAAITRFGRDWEAVHRVLPHKKHADFTDFYFSVWKCSKMYSQWKKIRKQRGLE